MSCFPDSGYGTSGSTVIIVYISPVKIRSTYKNNCLNLHHVYIFCSFIFPSKHSLRLSKQCSQAFCGSLLTTSQCRKVQYNVMITFSTIPNQPVKEFAFGMLSMAAFSKVNFCVVPWDLVPAADNTGFPMGSRTYLVALQEKMCHHWNDCVQNP